MRFILPVLILASLFAAPAARAEITVERASTLAFPSKLPTAGIFMLIRNDGAEPDRLVSATTARAATAMLKSATIITGGQTVMSDVKSILIPAKDAIPLIPSADSILLDDVTQTMVLGQSFPITLTFEKAGTKEVTVEIVSGEELDKRFPPEMAGPALRKLRAETEKAQNAGKPGLLDRLRDKIRGIGKEEERVPAPDAVTNEGMPVKVRIDAEGNLTLPVDDTMPAAPKVDPLPVSEQAGLPLPGAADVMPGQVALPPMDNDTPIIIPEGADAAPADISVSPARTRPEAPNPFPLSPDAGPPDVKPVPITGEIPKAPVPDVPLPNVMPPAEAPAPAVNVTQ